MPDKFFTNLRRKTLGLAFVDIFKGGTIAILVGDVFIKLSLLFKLISVGALVIILVVGLIILPKFLRRSEDMNVAVLLAIVAIIIGIWFGVEQYRLRHKLHR
ncbi:MAG: hypothetical protein AB7E08_03135 [Candidatus Omnitrophota bacterium]